MYPIILCTYIRSLLYSVARIIKPPENVTVCEGAWAVMRCGYQSDARLPVTWIIDGVSYNEREIESDFSYQLGNKSNPMSYGLAIFFLNFTTTVQCSICSPPKYSTLGTITVVHGKCLTCIVCLYICAYTHITLCIKATSCICIKNTEQGGVSRNKYSTR